jgi:hypothetical protein
VIVLAAVRFESWDLTGLHKLPELRLFDCPLYWPKSELINLARHHPRLISNALKSGA